MKILAVYGTRPEKLKLDPVVRELEERGHEVEMWWSGQSPDLFDREPPFEWYGLRCGFIDTCEKLTIKASVDVVLVVGDTATALAGAQSAFMVDTLVGHVEAGLRTYEREPWPEESFRQSIRAFAEFHFCPDERARINVMKEQGLLRGLDLNADHDISITSDRHFVTGNPSIDALGGSAPLHVVATFHRRENWGERIEDALSTLHGLAEDDLFHPWVFTHPNWTKALSGDLSRFSNIHFCDPTSHEVFLDEIEAADVVVTDSGGVQEECAALGTDCLIYRTSTERKALEANGAVELVDPRNPNELRNALSTRIDRRVTYGRGDAAEKIVDVLEEELG